MTCGARVRLSNFGKVMRPNRARWDRAGTVMQVDSAGGVWVCWDGQTRRRRYDPDELDLADLGPPITKQ